jgi:hypothetical protein
MLRYMAWLDCIGLLLDEVDEDEEKLDFFLIELKYVMLT